MRSFVVVLAALAVVQSAAAQSQPSTGRYVVANTHIVGGDGGWDYVIPDPARHRVFVARENRVMVLDENDGRLLGEVAGIHGAHGVAIVEKVNRGYATSSEDSSIYSFDLRTLHVTGRTHADDDADAIIYDAPSDRVFSFNGDANNATVLDARTRQLVRNVALAGKSESGVSAGNGKVYVNLVDSSQVVEIDARTLAVTRRWSTAPCKQPVSMAIDVAHRRLF